jgi:leucine-rich repeat-containing G protein-coupled receptor 7/leucine-rich repeat-containing G protein-coupled receptor 8
VIAYLPFLTRKSDISNAHFEYNALTLENSLPYLAVLFASNSKINFIRSETFKLARNIFHLDLSNNDISLIQTRAFFYLNFLKTLELHGNKKLATIESYSFIGLKMSILEINKAKLKALDAQTFSGLNVQNLDLSDNDIESISAFAFDNLSVEFLNVNKNPIKEFNRDLFVGIKNIKSLQTPSFRLCCIKPVDLLEENCLPHKDEFSSCEDLMRNTTLQALLWTICILSIVGNILSMLYRVVFDSKRLKLGYGIFVTNLSAADLLMGIYLLIIAVADKMFRNRYS